MKSYAFKVVIEQDQFEDGRTAYHASCPALRGCHTWGHTQEEALANIRDAIELYIEDMVDAGEAFPNDAEHGVVEVPSPSVVVNV